MTKCWEKVEIEDNAKRLKVERKLERKWREK